MNARNERSKVTRSIIVGGDASEAIIQNVHEGASAAIYQEQGGPDADSIQELIEKIRALLNEARPDLDDADECDAALDEIAADVASPKEHRFSIRGALDVLKNAAVLVTGWSEAVSALRQAIGKL